MSAPAPTDERTAIISALSAARGSPAKAAAALGWSLRTFHRRRDALITATELDRLRREGCWPDQAAAARAARAAKALERRMARAANAVVVPPVAVDPGPPTFTRGPPVVAGRGPLRPDAIDVALGYAAREDALALADARRELLHVLALRNGMPGAASDGACPQLPRPLL